MRDACPITPVAVKTTSVLAGAWQSNDGRFRYDISGATVRATFNACATMPSTPRCTIVAVTKNGRLDVDGGLTITVRYDDGSVGSFNRGQNCHGALAIDVSSRPTSPHPEGPGRTSSRTSGE